MDRKVYNIKQVMLKMPFFSNFRSVPRLQLLVQKHEMFPRQFCSYKELKKLKLHKQHSPVNLLVPSVQKSERLTKASTGKSFCSHFLPAAGGFGSVNTFHPHHALGALGLGLGFVFFYFLTVAWRMTTLLQALLWYKQHLSTTANSMSADCLQAYYPCERQRTK